MFSADSCWFEARAARRHTMTIIQARTAAAVASLRALMEITANVSDPVGRKAFSSVRTGQMLLSIITRQHGSAVLQASSTTTVYVP